MKRIATILAGLALALGLVGFTSGPASAEGACEFSIPQFPDECVSEAMYDYVTELQADDLAQRIRASHAEADAYQLRTEMWQMAVDIQAARQATSIAMFDRNEALAQVARLTLQVKAQRATIKHLRDRLHTVI